MIFITTEGYENEKRFSEEQIISILREAEPGLAVEELCRRYNVHGAPFYTWRKFLRNGGSRGTPLKAVEGENARIKRLFSESLLGNDVLKAALNRICDCREQARGLACDARADADFTTQGLSF